MAQAERKFFTSAITGARCQVGGCWFSDTPSNLPSFGASRTLSNKELPHSVDMRQLMTPIEHQGQTNSYVANALAGAYEFLIMKNTKKHVDVSRLFLYYNGRKLSGKYNYQMIDNGTYISSAIAGLTQYGCCKEELFPFNIAFINQKPPQRCYTEAAKHCIKESMTVAVELNDMKGCLAEGFPFPFGLQLYKSFSQSETNGGRVLMPNQQAGDAQEGGHAMLAVGYSNAAQCFIVRNSYGDTWGDKGYVYIPYQYMCNPSMCTDLHCIKLIHDEPGRRETTNVVNPYVWNVDKDKSYYIPPNYTYPNFDYTFFWKLNDNFNYFNSIWIGGHAVPFVWGKPQTDHSNYPDRTIVAPTTEAQMLFVLWIDKKNIENTHIVNKLTSEKNVTVDFRETYSSGEAHISTIKNKIKSPSTFLIICRGHYKDENKNPLNLLRFLNYNSLRHVPVIVFTQDKNGLQNHFHNQASSMDTRDWQQRLFITSSSDELIMEVKKRRNHQQDRYN
ncbi:unnamed protein product [Rotaria socialis]|uniref:Peptidase C1A papain C-terminal domain-containing protein n=1 Tax=Rotaria socialis TaxID=392032 RepID=A0A820WKW4_9BILA|nr:unnamed protein product [Rotaria socialis]